MNFLIWDTLLVTLVVMTKIWKKQTRNLYAVGNMVTRKFAKCSEEVKLSLFKTYFYNIYCCSLWANYRVRSYKMVKVAHNDVFRSLLNMPRYTSASSLFVMKNIDNLDVMMRKNMFSLENRMLRSMNSIVKAVMNSESRMHSCIWNNFDLKLRVSMVLWLVPTSIIIFL